MVPKKLPGAGGGKAIDNNRGDRHNWDLKEDVRYLEEGIDKENKHFQLCLREEAELWEECQNEAEAIPCQRK